MIDWHPIGLTLKLAFVSTICLILIGTPIAWWLARTASKWRAWVATIVALPLVLPPTVLGFYLLISLGPEGLIGKTTQALGIGLLPFSFSGLVIGSIIYSLPFVVGPLQNAFEAVGNRPLEIAATLGASPLKRFFTIVMPLAKPGLISAGILGFAHTIGEFGIVLMIGGNIPGETRVLSVAIYDHVEALEYTQAHILSAGILLFSFGLLFFIYSTRRRSQVNL